jgi:hypothetical protein
MKEKFVTVCQTFEYIIRERVQNAFVMLHYNMLKCLFCNPFESLERSVSSGNALGAEFHIIYDRVLDLLLVIMQCCPQVNVEIRRTNLISVVRSLLVHSLVDVSLTTSLLRLPEKLMYTDLQNSEQHVLLVINLLPAVKGSYDKLNCILSCLCRIFVNEPESIVIWDRVGGLMLLADLLGSMKGDIMSEVNSSSAFESLKYIMRAVSLTLTISNSNWTRNPSENTKRFSSENLQGKLKGIANALLKIEIFTSKWSLECLKLVFEVVSGRSEPNRVINHEGIGLLLELCCQVNTEIGQRIIGELKRYASANTRCLKSLSESRSVCDNIFLFILSS